MSPMFLSWVKALTTALAIEAEEKPKLVDPPVEKADAVAEPRVREPIIVEAATAVVAP